jgi:uncharacterized protein YprB with RNaseH-like and TPR domain/predicted nuclease with RNAse H fold
MSGSALLPETFVHMPGIGIKTECRLWQEGHRSWDDLRHSRFARRAGVAELLAASEEALDDGDVGFFFASLPAQERWRTLPDFGQRFVALDIETTGMSVVYDEITVIGTEQGGQYRAFVRGSNLEDAAELLAEADGLITFNGSLFDLPFIARAFPGLELPKVHLDLRFLSRRVGWPGGLKVVEQSAKLRRADALDDISGYEATVLWSEFQHGRLEALRDLVSYNAADTCVLRPLAELVVERLRQRLEELRVSPMPGQLLFDPDAWEREERARRRDAGNNKPPKLPAVRKKRAGLQVGRQLLAWPPRRGLMPATTLGALHQRMRDPGARIVGIDLTGSAARPTGWALLSGNAVVTGTLGNTEEILERTLACRPQLVSIDSPLSLPVGRHCTDDSCECRPVGGITRHCERELKRRGVNVYPCLIRSMQALTRRGIQIAQALRAEGVEVIESYPGAAQDIMRIPRKRASQEQLRAGLERFGIHGIRPAGQLTHDELDAVTSAAVGAFYLADLYEAIGNEQEEFLIIPALEQSPAAPPADTEPTDQPRFLLLGPGAPPALAALRLDHLPWSLAAAGNGTRVFVSDDPEAYWEALAHFGPSLRAARVWGADTRLPRRPTFVDLELRLDSPQRTRLLRRWTETQV